MVINEFSRKINFRDGSNKKLATIRLRKTEQEKKVQASSTEGCNLPVFVSPVCLPITVTVR